MITEFLKLYLNLLKNCGHHFAEKISYSLKIKLYYGHTLNNS